MRRVLVVLLALAAAALAAVALHGSWFGRGAGGVELMLSALLLCVAWVLVKSGRIHGALAGLVFLLPPLVMAGVAGRAHLNATADANLQACLDNLATLAGSVERARKVDGRLPETLPAPEPVCPVAGPQAYGYEAAGGAYTLYCRGDAHSRHFYDDPRLGAPNYPQFGAPPGEVVLRP